MPGPVAALLQETLDALRVLDAERLERLAEEAEALQARCAAITERPLELRALRKTLLEVLRSTEGNLRVLRGLRAQGEGLRWER